MHMRLTLPITTLTAAALVVAVAGPSDAGITYSVSSIQLSNTQANPQAIASDPLTGTLYVGEQDGAAGAKIAVLSPAGKLRADIRVGESYDPARNLPPDGERPAPHVPSRVIALTINSLTHTLLALVTDTFINTVPTYSGLSGSYVVAVNMWTSSVTKRYTVASPAPESDPGWHDPRTMWTGFSLDPIHNVLWGVEGYDPGFKNAVDRLNLTTGTQDRAALPIVANDAPIDAVPTIAFNLANGRGYVSVAGAVFVVDSALRVVNRLQLPGLPGCDELPGTAPTATVAAPWTNTVYTSWCRTIYAINGTTNTVTHPFPTVSLGKTGLALDPLSRSLYVYEVRNEVPGLGIYSTATNGFSAFLPLSSSDGVSRVGNAWMTNNPLIHRTYVTGSASTIDQVQRR